MSNYTRKTKDWFAIEGNYGGGFEIVTHEETRKEAKEMLKCYRENEPRFCFRMRKYREPIMADK